MCGFFVGKKDSCWGKGRSLQVLVSGLCKCKYLYLCILYTAYEDSPLKCLVVGNEDG
jgi:hypothetical protein